MNEYEKALFAKGYIRLQPGSYRIWISKKWHEMFVRRGFVKKNIYKQYCPNTTTLAEFIKWDSLYERVQHDRDFPRSYKQVTPEEIIEIRGEIA